MKDSQEDVQLSEKPDGLGSKSENTQCTMVPHILTFFSQDGGKCKIRSKNLDTRCSLSEQPHQMVC
jgi:hypothetical protein